VRGTPREVPGNLAAVDPAKVAAAQQGDALALDQLLDELAPYVRRLCARIAPAAADDATQEALLAIFRGLPSLRAPEAIMTWGRSVTVRTAMRFARQLDQEVAAGPTPADPCVPSFEGLADIDDALARLPLSQRAVLVLRTREGLSEQEIATTLGISAGTVKSRLHRARAAFREMWET
jgi:RNA polymerase sigma factor (sigma-70 family)